jgi:hypothetical protein
MLTDSIHILPTENTPEILLKPEGIIKIKGRGMVLDNTAITTQVISWLDKYMSDPAEVTYVSIGFEYLNSYCTSKLVSILRKIAEVTLHGKKYHVIWYYEEDDDDIQERGEYISATFNIPVSFVLTNDIKTCC